VDEIVYWNNRYAAGGDSGYGSYGEQLQKKLNCLRGLDIHSVVEVGCGDFNFGKHLMELYPYATYTGYDISNVIIEKNKRDYPQHSFTSVPKLPQADLVVCVDVLFHILDDTQVEKTLSLLGSLRTKYLALTAYEHQADFNNHLRVRKFDPNRFPGLITRQIVEKSGELFFYLYNKPTIDLTKVSCCLNTKENTYPEIILADIGRYPFGEVLIRTHSDSPYRKHELFQQAKYDFIYYQDDDAICPVRELSELSQPEMLNVAMKTDRDSYKDRRMTMGLGWGSMFPKSILSDLDKYRNLYGEDALFKRETEKILTYLHWPQNRLILPIIDLPSAGAPDRLYRQSGHYENMLTIEEKCRLLIGDA
jgi:hypothetical protein